MSSSNSTFKKLVARAKAHHRELNQAYDIYYSAGRSSTAKAVPAPAAAPAPERPTVSERKDSTSSSSTTSSIGKTWKSVKKAAKDHHDGLNEAFTIYYGGGRRSTGAPSSRGSVVSYEEEPYVSLIKEKEFK